MQAEEQREQRMKKMRAQRNLGEYKAHQHMHSGNMRDKEKEEKRNCRNNG